MMIEEHKDNSGFVSQHGSNTMLNAVAGLITKINFKKMNNVKNKLRVMHYAQVPCKPFIVDVSNEQEAKKIMDVLADQHLFLLEQNIIPDYSNALTVVMWDENADGEDNPDWVDYWNDEEGMDFDEFSETYLSNEVGS